MQRSEALVPMWIHKSGNRALDALPSRPVLIEVRTIGSVLHGTIEELRPSSARVLPGDPFFLWRSVSVTLRFRFSDTVYTLEGETGASYPDHSFDVTFDDITRQRIAILGRDLESAGCLSEEELKAGIGDLLSPEDLEDRNTAERIEEGASASDADYFASGGSERREHERHTFPVSATVQKISTGESVECQMLEISLGGCRIEAKYPVAFAVGDELEVQFASRGMPCRLLGKVQFASPPNVAGMMFVNMSTRTSQRLSELILELEEEKNSPSMRRDW